MKRLALAFALILCTFTSPALAMPNEGDEAPGFTLKAQDGKDVSLSDYKGKWVVLYFYPKDFTSGCSIQAKTFQENLPKYREKNAVILGVSVDSVESHKDFCIKQGLEFTLLSDEDKAVSNQYDSFSGLLGIGVATRNTFLIDTKGIVRKVYTDVNPRTNAADVLKDLEALQNTK